MKMYVHLWYFVEFFLEWEMFQKKVAEKVRTHTECIVACLREQWLRARATILHYTYTAYLVPKFVAYLVQ